MATQQVSTFVLLIFARCYCKDTEPLYQDRIKGLILRRCGKLNFTYHEVPQYTRYSFIHCVLRLLFCGSSFLSLVYCRLSTPVTYLQILSCRTTQAAYMRDKKESCVLRHLVYCGGTAVGIDGQQYKPFYMVSFISFFMNSLVSHFFQVSINYLHCIHCLLH